VLDPFRPPPEPWLAGNRGIEYATAAGVPVAAIGPGVVTFAGPVAGRLVATVEHPDGLRSSYVELGRLLVARGQVVAAGEPVGIADGPVHLGVRRGSTYLDPASLWGAPVLGGRSVLVPTAP
jgi:murein DD-endopeptidase MepM/ murein hydrolase activator NlpD